MIVFRADASDRMGTGHVRRCLTLAQALRARGAQTHFVCREHPGDLVAALRENGQPVSTLPAPAARSAGAADDSRAWLGVSAREDAEQTIAGLPDGVADWIVVDHYGIDHAWERLVSLHAGQLLVIDDLANRPHDCDALLDQNYAEDGARRYRGLVPERCRVSIGPRFALLAPEYARYRENQTARDGVVRHVLVYFGGSDPDNMTGRALEALCAPEFSHLNVDLVIGTNSAHRTALEARAFARPRTQVHGTRAHLADLMVRSDLAIGAGGGTTWERMCLGLPSVVVSIAENQRPTNEALGAAGLIQYLGDVSAAGAAQIRDALRGLVADRDRVKALSAESRRVVDGQGAARVTDALLEPSGAVRIRTRHALHAAATCPEGFGEFTFAWIDRCDPERVLALRNMPHVTSQMRTRDQISVAQHKAFLQGYPDLDRYDFVLIDNSRGGYAGVFYLTGVGATPEIGKYLGDQQYLGRGIARKATERLLAFCRAKTHIHRLTSTTRRDNLRNIALNTGLGFTTVDAHDEYVVMALDL